MNILVTGGAGFIGSHVADALINAGLEVTIVDNLSTGVKENLPSKALFIEQDICEPDIENVFKEGNFDAVYHLAAQIDVRVSVRDPLYDIRVNVAGSVGLLDLARRFGVNRFIFASTGGAIYGEQEDFPASETHPVNPISPYGVAKLAVEKYMYFYHNQYGMHTIALRYGNVYGPRQNPLGEAGVIAIFCHNMLAGDQPYINGDGLQTRDYVFVDDVVRANTAALGLDGQHVINIGTGIETDVVTLFDKLNELTGDRGFERKHRPGAEGEQRRSVIDPTLAGRILGWSPEVGLTEGLEKTVNFFKARAVTTQNE